MWGVGGAVYGGSAMAAALAMGENIHLSPAMGIYFTIFYVLGFMLYSSISAAVGAMVNSEEEAQQLSFVVVMPIIVAVLFITVFFFAPSRPVPGVFSLVPFFVPPRVVV